MVRGGGMPLPTVSKRGSHFGFDAREARRSQGRQTPVAPRRRGNFRIVVVILLGLFALIILQGWNPLPGATPNDKDSDDTGQTVTEAVGGAQGRAGGKGSGGGSQKQANQEDSSLDDDEPNDETRPAPPDKTIHDVYNFDKPLDPKIPQRSHYSIGKVTPWVGNIDNLPAFQAALEARSYKKEIMMTMSDVPHLDFLFNLLLNMREQGFEHYMVLMLREDECKEAVARWPEIGCVWSDFLSREPPPQYWHNIRRLWMIRWMIFSRALQLGYNILMFDTDNLFTNDLYLYLKSDVFGEYNLLTAYEPNLPGINCGLIYAQNARADGPTAWMAAEVAQRTLTWLEQPDVLAERHPGWQDDHEWMDNKILYEQDIYNDAACSAMAGFALFRNSLSPHTTKEPELERKWTELHDPLCSWTQQKITFPQSWLDIAGYATMELNSTSLQLPWYNETWFKVIKDEPFPFEPAGTYTDQLDAWLWQFSGPKWVKPKEDDPKGKRQLRERMVRSPDWLFSRWPEVGIHGGWWQKVPRGVLGHAIVILGTDGEGKYAPFKVMGWWHWEVNTLLDGKLFRSSTDKRPLPRVLAVAPGANLYFVNFHQILDFVNNMAKLAVMSDRVMVWPHIDCRCPFLKKLPNWIRNASHPHPMHDHRILAYGEAHDLKCLYFRFMYKGCHEVGMPHYDFEKLLEELENTGLADVRTPREENTLLYDQLQLAEPADFVANYTFNVSMEVYSAATMVQDTRVNVDATEIEEVLAGMAEEPVVYLARFVRVVDYGVKRFKKLERKFMPKCSFNPRYIGTLWQDAFNTERKESYSYPQPQNMIEA